MMRAMFDPLPLGEPVAGGSAQAFERAPLRGRFVELLPIDAGRDHAELFAAAHGSVEREQVWTYMGYGPFADEGAMGRWLAECSRSRDPLFFVARSVRSGRALGMASLLAIEPAQRRVEIGHIWYGPEAQRGVTNTEVAYLLMRDAFARRYRRVEWKCDALNKRSRRAALRLGFTFEGVFRQHLIVKGRSRDSAWFSLLEDEWNAARRAMEAWLGWEADARPPLAELRGREE